MLKAFASCSRRTAKIGQFLRRIVVVHLGISLVALAPGGSQMTQVLAQVVGPDASAIERLETLFDRLTDLRATIDRSTFDADALAFEMAFEDADTIIDWIRGAIAFEQYSGVLRGPDGTLMARAGNAYDQALLLATLLKGAGYDVRIAEGTLDRENAATLLAELGQPREVAPDGIDVAAATEAIAGLMALAGQDVADAAAVSDALAAPADLGPEAEPVLSAVAADTERLLGLLDAAGVSIGDAALADDLVEEARSYAWVEYRLGSEDVWRAAHPTFGVGRGTPASLDPTRTFEDVVPDDLLHIVRIESLLESRRGSSLVITDLMTPWERPSAAIVGDAITYMNVPGLAMTDPGAATDERLTASETFFPTLDGTFAPGAQAFDALGIAVPVDVALNQAAGVFRSVAAAGARGADALGGMGGGPDDGSGVRFERHLLRFSIVSPSGDATTVERVVAEHDEDPVAVARSLTQRLTFMVDVGASPASYLLDRQLERLLELRPVALAIVNGAITKEDPVGDGASLEGVATSWWGHELLYATFRAGAERSRPGLVSYRPAPALVAHGTTWTSHDTFSESIDVIANPRRVLRVDGARPVPYFDAMVEAGVWETHTEGSLLDVEGATTPSISTLAAIDAADASGTPLVVITPDREPLVDDLGLTPQAANNVRRDLAAGYVVVVPATAAVSVPLGGWWRVSLADGETLGITGDGRGANLVERATIFMGGIAVLAGSYCLGAWAAGGASGKLLTCSGAIVGGTGGFLIAASPPAAGVLGIVGLAAIVLSILDVVLVSP